MKNLVLKVPTALFILAIFLPAMIFVLQIMSGEELIKPESYYALSIIGSITSTIWLFSVVDYFQSKLSGYKYLRLIYLLLVMDASFILLNHFEFSSSSVTVKLSLMIAQIVVFVIATVFITMFIRKVFYERATWFVVLEILTVIVGIVTLTAEIKRNEQELNGEL